MAVIAGVLGRAGQRGQRRRLKAAETGEVTWQNPTDVGKFITLDAKLKRAEKKKAMEEASDRDGRGSQAELEAFSYFQKQRDNVARGKRVPAAEQPESSS